MTPTDGEDASWADVSGQVKTLELLNKGLGAWDVPGLGLLEHGVLLVVVGGGGDSGKSQSEKKELHFTRVYLIIYYFFIEYPYLFK